MKIHEITSVIGSDYRIKVTKKDGSIESFSEVETEKRTKYRNAEVRNIYPDDEVTIIINAEEEE